MSANSRKTGNLVALGSAAVVAVYGAGFMRTAAAAERFAQQSNERVLSPAEAEVIASMAQDTLSGGATASNDSSLVRDAQSAPTATPAGKVDATTAKVASNADGADSRLRQQESAKNAIATTAASDKRSAARGAQTPPPDAMATSTASGANNPTVPTNTALTSQTAASANAAPTTSAVVTAANAPVAAAVSSPTSPTAATTTPASAAAPTAPTPSPAKAEEPAVAPSADAKAALKWKDGNYTGYGSSRHGDIEVYLETDGGKISYIKISQCLTQYSCSWISELPGQVIARQSPKVDAVSGATVSATAFYYAVVQALSKAK